LYLTLKQYYKSIIIGSLILWLSLSGSNSLVPGRLLNIPYIDKLGHFAMYSFFSAVLLLDSCRWHVRLSFRYLILLIPLVFGATLELLQMTLTTTRKAEFFDLAANIFGIAAGILLACFVKKLIARFI
jgi:VanZ family protein